MKSIQEISQKKLKLYDAREKFVRIINDNKIDSEFPKAACQIIEQTYSALIEQLNWILTDT